MPPVNTHLLIRFCNRKNFRYHIISVYIKNIAKNGNNLHEITSLPEVCDLLQNSFLQIINPVSCQGCTVHTICDHSSCLRIQIQNRDRRDYREGDLQLVLT